MNLAIFSLPSCSGSGSSNFPLGFGNKVVGRKWGETEYLISAFPLGGYVKMFGEEQGEEVIPEDEHRSFSHKPVWQRFGIVVGGPVFNLLFAVILFFFMFFFAGLPEPMDTTMIGEVDAGSVAEKVGIKSGDKVSASTASRPPPGSRSPTASRTAAARK